MRLDLNTATYNEFVSFAFDHYPSDSVDDAWYWADVVEIIENPARAIALLTKLCREAGSLLDSYTPEQVTEGICFLFSARGQDEFSEQLWNPIVTWPARRRCIQVLPQLYYQVFERHPDATASCAYMFWDWVTYGYHCGTRKPGTSAEDARVQEALFAAIAGLLDSPHSYTQQGALHGLGHLHHPQSSQRIRAFLSSHRAIEPEIRSYAAAVLEGHFL